MNDQRRRSKLQFTLIALLFVVPLLLATIMYSFGRWLPAGSTNHGAVLQPVINLADELPRFVLPAAVDGLWLMVYRNENPSCDAACRDALLRLRQSRLMLGNDMNRVARLFLHGDTTPDTVFIDTHHAGLITKTDRALQGLLERQQPAGEVGGGIFLVDPMGNLVMYFPPDLSPAEMVDDIKHLLDLSRIG